jgi:DNA polymerase beta
MSDIKAKIIDAFTVLQQAEAAAKHETWQFKVRAYKKVIEQLRATAKNITKLEDLDDIDGVGVKMRKKVEEILSTGQLAAAEEVKEGMQLGPIEVLKGVHGIGDAKAKELIAGGIKTIAQLRAAAKATPKLLNKTQTTGLQYYDDIMKRIPRAELEKHEAVLLGELPPGMKGTIVGSYRRGAETSGDIDMLITMEVSEDKRTTAFHGYVKALRDKGYMIEELSKGTQKNLSIVRLTPESPARRLDLLVIPVEQFPYALLYFTGSQEFNVGFRKHALKKGYTLNEHEMKLTGKVNGAKAVPLLKTEEDVFAFLGIEYKEPKKRVSSADVKILEGAAAPAAEAPKEAVAEAPAAEAAAPTAEAEAPKEAAAPAEAEAKAPTPKKGKWVQKTSKTTGKTYWWNKETKQSTWEKPPNARGGTRRSKKNKAP